MNANIYMKTKQLFVKIIRPNPFRTQRAQQCDFKVRAQSNIDNEIIRS